PQNAPLSEGFVGSSYGMRTDPFTGQVAMHAGVDFAAPTGTPIYAAAGGVVTSAEMNAVYGNTVEVDHGNGNTTLYAHLSRIDVRKGQTVERGQRIGAVGSTGWATGPHLHFEFKERGVHQDPLAVARRHQPATELSAQARPKFEQVAQSMRNQLVMAASVNMVASAR
ncbi:MAG TPA: M23 family metallopeptidase, partial [Ramlibacter sp.]|nr:M23 family metallopeptidase [Ramlibacter sp.]